MQEKNSNNKYYIYKETTYIYKEYIYIVITYTLASDNNKNIVSVFVTVVQRYIKVHNEAITQYIHYSEANSYYYKPIKHKDVAISSLAAARNIWSKEGYLSANVRILITVFLAMIALTVILVIDRQ